MFPLWLQPFPYLKSFFKIITCVYIHTLLFLTHSVQTHASPLTETAFYFQDTDTHTPTPADIFAIRIHAHTYKRINSQTAT